jgi:hypothetical protein
MSQVPLYVEGYLRFFDTLDAAVVWDCSFFFTLVTGPARSLSLKSGDTRVYGHQIRALLGNHNKFLCISGGRDHLMCAVDPWSH